MTPEEHARIAAAVQAAEARTAGEIHCVVAGASDSYFFPAAFMVTVAVIVVSLLVAWLLDLWWYELEPLTLAGAQLATILCALLVLWAFPGIRIHFVPLQQRYRRAHDNAMKQFLSRNIHVTSARTGVMLFVSRAERYAEIIADNGINSRVSQDTWDGVVSALIAQARQGRVADGFVEAVGTVGALLAQHFPVAAGDANELDDHVVEI